MTDWQPELSPDLRAKLGAVQAGLKGREVPEPRPDQDILAIVETLRSYSGFISGDDLNLVVYHLVSRRPPDLTDWDIEMQPGPGSLLFRWNSRDGTPGPGVTVSCPIARGPVDALGRAYLCDECGTTFSSKRALRADRARLCSEGCRATRVRARKRKLWHAHPEWADNRKSKQN